jgi:shikimate dehydrogenase
MFPDIGQSPPIPYEYLTDKHLLFDLVYNPVETKFLEQGRLRRAQTKNGLEMLQLQAEASWTIWNS